MEIKDEVEILFREVITNHTSSFPEHKGRTLYRFRLKIVAGGNKSHEEIAFYFQVPEEVREIKLREFKDNEIMNLALMYTQGDIFTHYLCHRSGEFSIHTCQKPNPIPISKELGKQIVDAYVKLLSKPFKRLIFSTNT